MPLTDCPECGKRSLNKLVTAAGFQLKGSGWYATDFRNNDSKPKKEQDSSAESTKKSESKAEAGCGTGACPACS